MNPKVNKLRAEKAKNCEKIAKMTARNEEIDREVMRLENIDIIGMVRAFGVSPDQLYELLQSNPAAVSDAARASQDNQPYDDGQSYAEPQDYMDGDGMEEQGYETT